MKWYGIDEDIYIALVDLLGEARSAAKSVGDDDSHTYYTFLLGELESAKKIGKGKPMDDEQNARMMKLQRYLRMLQEGLRDPKDLNKKNRRKLAREVIDPEPKNDLIDKVSMTDVKRFLIDDPELTDAQLFELYYDERERRIKAKEASEAQTLDEMLDDIGIQPYKPNKGKKR